MKTVAFDEPACRLEPNMKQELMPESHNPMHRDEFYFVHQVVLGLLTG
jgi:hypothetical protein